VRLSACSATGPSATTVLRESNVVAQKFFYECAFVAGRVAGPLKGWFGTEDAVAMRRPAVLPVP
jgi:hypothetical protein